MPGTVLGIRDKGVNNTEDHPFPHGSFVTDIGEDKRIYTHHKYVYTHTYISHMYILHIFVSVGG